MIGSTGELLFLWVPRKPTLSLSLSFQAALNLHDLCDAGVGTQLITRLILGGRAPHQPKFFPTAQYRAAWLKTWRTTWKHI